MTNVYTVSLVVMSAILVLASELQAQISTDVTIVPSSYKIGDTIQQVIVVENVGPNSLTITGRFCNRYFLYPAMPNPLPVLAPTQQVTFVSDPFVVPKNTDPGTDWSYFVRVSYHDGNQSNQHDDPGQLSPDYTYKIDLSTNVSPLVSGNVDLTIELHSSFNVYCHGVDITGPNGQSFALEGDFYHQGSNDQPHTIVANLGSIPDAVLWTVTANLTFDTGVPQNLQESLVVDPNPATAVQTYSYSFAHFLHTPYSHLSASMPPAHDNPVPSKMHFDKDRNPATDSNGDAHWVRINYSTPLTSETHSDDFHWVNGSYSHALVYSQGVVEPKFDVLFDWPVGYPDTESWTIWAENDSSDAVTVGLGDVEEVKGVTLPASTRFEFQFSGSIGSSEIIGRYHLLLNWKGYLESDSNKTEVPMGTTQHYVYVILGRNGENCAAPWDSSEQEYSLYKSSPQRYVPWLEYLHVVAEIVAGESTAEGVLGVLEEHLFSKGGAYYNSVNGGPNYTIFGGPSSVVALDTQTFLAKWLASDLEEVNCSDMAAGLACLANLVGADAREVAVNGWGAHRPMRPVGTQPSSPSGWTNNPFFDNVTYSSQSTGVSREWVLPGGPELYAMGSFQLVISPSSLIHPDVLPFFESFANGSKVGDHGAGIRAEFVAQNEISPSSLAARNETWYVRSHFAWHSFIVYGGMSFDSCMMVSSQASNSQSSLQAVFASSLQLAPLDYRDHNFDGTSNPASASASGLRIVASIDPINP